MRKMGSFYYKIISFWQKLVHNFASDSNERVSVYAKDNMLHVATIG